MLLAERGRNTKVGRQLKKVKKLGLTKKEYWVTCLNRMKGEVTRITHAHTHTQEHTRTHTDTRTYAYAHKHTHTITR